MVIATKNSNNNSNIDSNKLVIIKYNDNDNDDENNAQTRDNKKYIYKKLESMWIIILNNNITLTTNKPVITDKTLGYCEKTTTTTTAKW